jgi:hypothetical protein
MGGGNHLYGQGIYTGYSGKPWVENGKVFCKYADYVDVAPDHAFYQDYQYVCRTREVIDRELIEQWIEQGLIPNLDPHAS